MRFFITAYMNTFSKNTNTRMYSYPCISIRHNNRANVGALSPVFQGKLSYYLHTIKQKKYSIFLHKKLIIKYLQNKNFDFFIKKTHIKNIQYLKYLFIFLINMTICANYTPDNVLKKTRPDNPERTLFIPKILIANYHANENASILGNSDYLFSCTSNE